MHVRMRLHHHSYEDYLALEETSAVRHEFLDGQILAMAPSSARHTALSAAVLTALGRQLAGRCRIFASDLRVRVPATGLASYPDVAVVFGQVETDPANKDTIVNPSAIVEVLSPATADYDLGEKFEHYRQVPSLNAVIYVWQDRRQLEVRQRTTAESWQSKSAGAGASLPVPALGLAFDVDALYVSAGA
jgi:Uma2 family endonuclease